MIIRIITFWDAIIDAAVYTIVYASGRTLEITHEMNLPKTAKRFMAENPSYVHENGTKIYFYVKSANTV